MSSVQILFGHPGGAPHSHNAALAHFERGRLEAFCVPWMPTPGELSVLSRLPGMKTWAARLQRRSFPPLYDAPKIEGRLSEWIRMAKRVILEEGVSAEALAYEANDWLMKTMARECKRSSVTAVHSYEDCSLDQFEVAKKLGKPCIYDMPIGYYPAWEATQERLLKEFADWLPETGFSSKRFVRPSQKKREMELADLVLGPCTFVAQTIAEFVDKPFALAPYGVDSNFWHPNDQPRGDRPFRFIYTGHSSIRKGIPLLLQAWERANLREAELVLVGTWQLSNRVREKLPANVKIVPACSALEVRTHYQSADAFVFPSYFEGFGLVLLEAMACGLPVISTEASVATDITDDSNARLFRAGDGDHLIAHLQFFAQHRELLPSMSKSARAKAETLTWENYRAAVAAACEAVI